MEPNKIIPTPAVNTNPSQDPNTTLDGLRDEGIDIVQGSGVSEDNEFSNGEATPVEIFESASVAENVPVAPVVPPTPVTSIPKPPQQIVTAPKPPVEEYNIAREGARMLGALQEMPKSFIPTQKPPQSTPQFIVQPRTAVTPAVTPEPSQAHPFNDPSIRQIRTFKSDAEEAVKYQNVSAVDIAIAEQKKRERSTSIEYETPHTSHAGLFIILSICLIIVLGGGWYYWFSSSQNPEIKKAPAVAIQTIVPYTKGSTLTLDPNSDPFVLIGAKLAGSNAGLGNIFALIPVESTNSINQIDISQVLKNTTIPNRLLRSLGTKYMIGAYTYDTQSPFLILTNTFFQNAFSGMLEWEKSMREDFMPLIQVSHPNEVSTGALGSSFQDALISNIDVRVLYNDAGETILMYAFADKDTIIITTDKNTLNFILDRLLTVRTIQ